MTSRINSQGERQARLEKVARKIQEARWLELQILAEKLKVTIATKAGSAASRPAPNFVSAASGSREIVSLVCGKCNAEFQESEFKPGGRCPKCLFQLKM